MSLAKNQSGPHWREIFPLSADRHAVGMPTMWEKNKCLVAMAVAYTKSLHSAYLH